MLLHKMGKQLKHGRSNVWKFYGEELLFGVAMQTAYFAILSPFHLVTTRLAVDVGGRHYTPQYTGAIDCIAQALERVINCNSHSDDSL